MKERQIKLPSRYNADTLAFLYAVGDAGGARINERIVRKLAHKLRKRMKKEKTMCGTVKKLDCCPLNYDCNKPLTEECWVKCLQPSFGGE